MHRAFLSRMRSRQEILMMDSITARRLRHGWFKSWLHDPSSNAERGDLELKRTDEKEEGQYLELATVVMWIHGGKPSIS